MEKRWKKWMEFKGDLRWEIKRLLVENRVSIKKHGLKINPPYYSGQKHNKPTTILSTLSYKRVANNITNIYNVHNIPENRENYYF